MVNDDPYFGVEISSLYHDSTSISNVCAKFKSSVFLSINIQSLMSKHEQLVHELSDLEQKNVIVDVIAIQETWDIKYPELVNIEGFSQFVFKRRRGMRGGGVGFYVRNGINVEIIEDLSPFENKIIEAVTI
jgi:exonuclease III